MKHPLATALMGLLLLVGCPLASAVPKPLLYASFDRTMQADFGPGGERTPMASMGGPWVAGVRGQARQLGGKNTAVYYVDEGFLPPRGTCSLWVQSVDWTPGRSDHFVFFASFNWADADGKYVRVILYKVYNETNLTLLVQNTTDEQKVGVVKHPLEFWQKGEWHHLAFTWDAERYRFYVDGKAAGETQTVPLPQSGRWEIRVGTPYAGWIHVGNEQTAIDEFTVWAEALPAREITAMYESVASSLPQSPPDASEGSAPPGRENLAHRRNGAFVLASSFANVSTSYTDNLVDGNVETFWRPMEKELPQWIEVRWDLPLRINEVALRQRKPGGVTAFTVHVWGAADQVWRALSAQRATAEADGLRLTAEVPETQTDRLRVVIDEGDASALTLASVEVYGPEQPLIHRLKPYWKGSYIWYPEPDKVHKANAPRYFRHLFEVADLGRVRSALLQLRSNDHFRAWLNGTEVAKGSKVISPVEVAANLVAGRNVLAVEADLHSNPGRWGWGELLYELALNYDDHSEYVPSGAETISCDRLQDGWQEAGFAAEGWVPAARFVSPPDGVWGEIPYYATPVGEHATLEGFRVRPEAPRPGQQVEVEVALRPRARLRDDYAFVLDIGDKAELPDWDDYGVATVPLVPAAPTSTWKSGASHALTFSFHLPTWAPDGTVPVRLKAYGTTHGGPLELDDATGGAIAAVGEMQISRAPAEAAEPDFPSLDFSRGAAAFARTGRLSPLVLWALRAHSYDRYEAYSGTGVHLYHVQTHPHKIDDSPATRSLVQRFLDKRITTILRVDPQAQFLVMIELRPSSAWLEANPDERLRTAHGALGPVSYCSAAYLTSTDDFLRRLIGYLKTRPYWERIIGYLPMSCGAPDSTLGGAEGNLFQEVRSKLTVGDFNPQALAAFRDWLKEKYAGSAAALRAAWNAPAVTFGTATPSIDELVREGAEGGVFRDPRDSGMTLDYFEFLSGMMGRFYSHVMRTVKDAAGQKVLAGTYYGYSVAHLRGYNMPGGIFNGNNFDLPQRLEDPNWDFFAGPAPYESRPAGNPFKSYHAAASVLLHGKLLINELDHRTFIASPTTYGRLRSGRETEAALKREIGGSLVDGSGYWFADWSGAQGRAGVGFFIDPSILRTVRETTAAAGRALERPKKGGVEVAAFVHGNTMACHDLYRAAPLYHNLIARTVWQEMSRMGAPFDCYLLEDLADRRVRDGYKLYVFVNAFLLSDRERQLIDDLKRDGKTLLFFYAPGYAHRQTGLRDENIAALTGYQVSHRAPNGIMRYRLTNTSHPLTQGLPAGKEYALAAFSYELSRKLHPPAFGPVFGITDAGDGALAAHPDGTVALAARDLGPWKSVYCTVPYMAAELLRGVCRYAGVHLYCEEDVVLKADNRCLMVHNGYGAERELTLSLPETRDVLDLCDGSVVSSGVRSFRLKLREVETRLLGLSEGAN